MLEHPGVIVLRQTETHQRDNGFVAGPAECRKDFELATVFLTRLATSLTG